MMAFQEIVRLFQDADRRKARAERSAAIRGVVIGATVSLSIGAVLNIWSSYLSRKDESVRQEAACNRVVALYQNILLVAEESATAAVQSLQGPASPKKQEHVFLLPPYDEILHAQDQSLDALTSAAQQNLIRTESLYRAMRDDLSSTSWVDHTGETFGVPDTPAAKDSYTVLLQALSQQIAYTASVVASSKSCNFLSKTSLL